jgi:hypothetical protein
MRKTMCQAQSECFVKKSHGIFVARLATDCGTVIALTNSMSDQAVRQLSAIS